MLISAVHRDEAAFPGQIVNIGGSSDEYPGPLPQLGGDQGRHGLGGGDDVRGRCRNAHVGELIGDHGGGPSGVVRHETHAHATRTQPGHRGRCRRHDLGSEIHHAVQVEERGVMGINECFSHRPCHRSRSR